MNGSDVQKGRLLHQTFAEKDLSDATNQCVRHIFNRSHSRLDRIDQRFDLQDGVTVFICDDATQNRNLPFVLQFRPIFSGHSCPAQQTLAWSRTVRRWSRHGNRLHAKIRLAQPCGVRGPIVEYFGMPSLLGMEFVTLWDTGKRRNIC